jgi:hypothetical protein
MAFRAITDDNTVWPEDQPQTPPAPPQPGLWTRLTTPAPGSNWSPLSIPGILGGLWAGLKDVASVPTDLYSGKMDLNDPNQAVANAGRLFNAAGTVSGVGAPFAPTGPNILMAGARRSTAAAPAIVSAANPTSDQIAAIVTRAGENAKSPWPVAPPSGRVLDESPEAYRRTQTTVPQTSIRRDLPYPQEGDTLPQGGRVAPIQAANEGIAANIAERLYEPWMRDDPMFHFYSTGPLPEELVKRGILDPEAANKFLYDWSGQVAATSPQTTTPPNLRNAMWLLFNRAKGTPITSETMAANAGRPGFSPSGNVGGYGMMGSHADAASQFFTGDENVNTATKTSLFRRSVGGNTADPVVDMHDIRKTLWEYDQLHPGQLPRQWFTSPAEYDAYRANGGFREGQPLKGLFKESLEGTSRGGVERKIEYGPMADPLYRAGELLGAPPGMLQSGGWFGYGGQTGLRSPPNTLIQLLNNQLYDSARAAGVSPERMLDWMARKVSPLSQNDQGPQQTQIG